MTRPGPPIPPRPPYGPGGGPPGPPGPGGPPFRPRPPAPRGSRLRPPVVIAIVFVLVVAGAAAGIGILFLSGRAVAAEVLTEPINTAGANPFAPPVGTDQGGIVPVANTGGRFDPSTTPGLYGGTRDNRTCDGTSMVDFLKANPDKAAAWAGVLGLTPGEIPSYVADLTSVILRSDTYVTNHGFKDGSATTLTSVLQAGTAVLVDRFGTPRVKCFCGNPLTPAVVPTAPRYVGPTWPAFSQTNITTINQSTTVINNYTLVDPVSGVAFVRPAGSEGDDDQDADDSTVIGPTTAPPTTGPERTTPQATRTPPPTQDQPVDITRRGRVNASSTFPGGQFPASLGVDGDSSTSWFSAGPGGDGTSVYTWQAPGDVLISSVEIESNGRNSDPSIRRNFGFQGLTAQVLDSSGSVVFEQGGTLPGTPDPTVTFEPNVVGSTVRLVYSGHEDSSCGGFAELTVVGAA